MIFTSSWFPFFSTELVALHSGIVFSIGYDHAMPLLKTKNLKGSFIMLAFEAFVYNSLKVHSVGSKLILALLFFTYFKQPYHSDVRCCTAIYHD